MKHSEIISRLLRFTDPTAVIFAVTMRDILSAISQRTGQEALRQGNEMPAYIIPDGLYRSTQGIKLLKL